MLTDLDTSTDMPNLTTELAHKFNPFTADPVKALHFAILI